MPAGFRLGFLSHLHGTAPPDQLYRDYVELFVATEELGFDSAWAAAQTRPCSPRSARTWPAAARTTQRAWPRWAAAFAGEPVGGTDFRLLPEAGGLGGRLWQAAFSLEGARYVGTAGSRLLLNRATFGSEGRTDEVQAPWAEAYLAAHPGPADQARIGLSRGVYPAASKRAARSAIEAPVLRTAERMIKAGRFPAGLSAEEYFERMHISYGSPDEVAERLATDRVLPLATELIVQFSPAAPALDQAISALELLATRVAPMLGWKPQTH